MGVVCVHLSRSLAKTAKAGFNTLQLQSWLVTTVTHLMWLPCLLCERYTLDATYDISAPGQERRRSQSIVLSETIKVGSEKSDMPKMYTEMFDAGLSRMVSFGAGRAFASHKTCTAL